MDNVLSTSETATVKTSDKITFSGNGTETQPYEIANAHDLAVMSELINDELSNKHFRSAYYIQTNDIDMKNTAIEPIGCCENNSNAAFTGNYNGNYYSISNLNINSSAEYAGLFGKVDNSLGENSYCSISNLSVNGNIKTSGSNAGGIVGMVSGGASMYGCSFNGTVSGKTNSGGIVGIVSDGGIIDTCYHNGTVSGENAGGIAGNLAKTQENKKVDVYVVGCYHHNGKMNSSAHGGGIVGIDDVKANYYNNFYETGSSTGGVDGAVNENTKSASTKIIVELADTLGTPYVKNKDSKINNGAPVFVWQLSLHKFSGNGTETSPYLISNKNDLTILSEYLNDSGISYMFRGANYLQTVDIDLSGVDWIPISSLNNTFFNGNYNGGCHKIINMNLTKSELGGLFGRVSNGTISELSIEKASVKSDEYAGGIAAQLTDGAVIRNCCYNGDVSSKNAGGLAGIAYGGTITSSYTSGKITGTNTAGGIVGIVSEQGITIESSYHGSGAVTAETKGGIAGKTNENAKIADCFYLKDSVSGTATQAGSSVNSALMKSLADTLGESFTDDKNGYPIFTWQVSDVKEATKLGDVNCDSIITIADAVLMQKYLLGSYELNTQQHFNSDMNNDSRVNTFDMVLMRREIVKK